MFSFRNAIGSIFARIDSSSIICSLAHAPCGAVGARSGLCVKNPIVQRPGRAALATGLPPCSGILKSNLNKRIQSGVDPMLTAGAQVYAQWRQRDQNDPAGFGDSLTNGLTFVVQP